MAEVHKSVKEQLREIIFREHGRVTEYSAPKSLTQHGLAEAVGKTRAHVAAEIQKLVREDQVVPILRHIEGVRSRRKVYVPIRSHVIHERDIMPVRIDEVMSQVKILSAKMDDLQELLLSLVTKNDIKTKE